MTRGWERLFGKKPPTPPRKTDNPKYPNQNLVFILFEWSPPLTPLSSLSMSSKGAVFASIASSGDAKKKMKNRDCTASEVLNTTMAAPPKPNSRLLTFALQALVMALVVSLLLLFLAVAVFVLSCRALASSHRWALQPPGLELPRPLAGISNKVLFQLPEFNYGTGPADCAVCLDSFPDGERCRALPACGHVFHVHCVDRWQAKMPACPVCRAVVAGGGFVV